ncbi:hypothetical protein ACFSCZ_09515 [Siminovitchia sediminis]|uniref:Uncharacterized protein n=1 Tax=Siminovitchia sediminis TaxID=1274353 RepID=A0ABW4KFW5_9BACI
MKNHANGKNILYIHMNQNDKYILSHGIQFPDFMKGIPVKPANILLLCRQLEDGYYNMHTRLSFVSGENIVQLAEDGVSRYGGFCWVDFSEEEDLNELTGQELAELLYVGHMKSPLKPPFYRILGNQFVYLTHEDGYFNKIYYKKWDHFFSMMGVVLADRARSGREKTLFGLRKHRPAPFVPADTLQLLSGMLKEGAVFSFEAMTADRLKIDIPIWIVGDYMDMDEMGASYVEERKRPPDCRLVLDRKAGEWLVHM